MEIDRTIADLRREYSARELTESEVARDPVTQFDSWFQQALDSQTLDPNAMSLATADAKGRPSVRIVLLKGFDQNGFVFFTNYGSRKGRELAENPGCSLCFWWGELMRQVRIDGRAELIPESESDAYFSTRPLESQLGAWASEQSSVITDRSVLEHRMRKMRECYADQDIPRPHFWGGYRVKPDVVEFWQGRPSRLHDRLRYTLVDGLWSLHRLSP